MDVERIAEEVEEEADRDTVGLWWVCAYFPEPDEDATARRAGLINLCANLLDRPTIRCADFSRGTFRVWPEDGTSLARIIRGYDACGGRPGLGDVVWFSTDRYLRSLSDPPVVWPHESDGE
jgi:hypothetical protein